MVVEWLVVINSIPYFQKPIHHQFSGTSKLTGFCTRTVGKGVRKEEAKVK